MKSGILIRVLYILLMPFWALAIDAFLGRARARTARTYAVPYSIQSAALIVHPRTTVRGSNGRDNRGHPGRDNGSLAKLLQNTYRSGHNQITIGAPCAQLWSQSGRHVPTYGPHPLPIHPFTHPPSSIDSLLWAA